MKEMICRTCLMLGGVVLLLVGFAPSAAWAQQTSLATIVGKVVDESGLAMPGVTVTATSPALQVRAVTGVTDAGGNYRLLNLPAPGVYSVQYKIQGFQTSLRKGLNLPVGFAARVDITMKAGGFQETVEVTASPVIDTVSTTGSTTLGLVQIETLPRARGLLDLLPLAPGVSLNGRPDVGDSNIATAQNIISYGVILYPSLEVDGINITSDHFYSTSVYFNSFSLAETQFKTTALTAEVATAGVNMVSVMKSGGNDFHGAVQGAYQHPRFQSNNVTPALQAHGIRFTNPIRYYYDYAADLGGRIIRDKLWFYGGVGEQSVKQGAPNAMIGPDANGNWFGAGAPIGDATRTLSQRNIKLSYQLNTSTKLIGAWQRSHIFRSGIGSSRTLRSTTWTHQPMNMRKLEIQFAPNSRFFVNAVGGYGGYVANNDAQPGSDLAGNVPSLEQSTGLLIGPNATPFRRPNYSYQVRGTVGYVPGNSFLGGDHQFKLGTFNQWQATNQAFPETPGRGNYQLVFLRGVPQTITTFSQPINPVNRQTHRSVFATDTWTIRRVVINLGARWDRYHGFYPDQTKAPGQFSAGGTIRGADVITWSTVVPRLGASWDVRGDGKTVVKGFFGIFSDSFGPQAVGFHNPGGLVRTNYRWSGPCLVTNWNNVSYNNTSCNATPETLAGLNPSSPSFISASGGTNLVVNPNLKSNLTHEYSFRLERQVMENFSLSATYAHRRLYNLYFTLEPTVNIAAFGVAGSYYAINNVLRPYSAWNVPIIRQDLLSGAPVTVWTYPSTFAGAAFNQTTILNAPSDRVDYYHSFEVAVKKGYSQRLNGMASFWATKNHAWIQAISQSPNDDPFPIDDTWTWEARASLSYKLPAGVLLSGVYRAQRGFPGQRKHVFGSIPQAGTVTQRMGPLGEYRGPVISLLNLKATKEFRLSDTKRFEATFEVFNVLNSSAATSTSFLTGPTFGRPEEVISPRVARIGARVTF